MYRNNNLVPLVELTLLCLPYGGKQLMRQDLVFFSVDRLFKNSKPKPIWALELAGQQIPHPITIAEFLTVDSKEIGTVKTTTFFPDLNFDDSTSIIHM